ncbi:MAG: pseudouridine synthase [Ignavibacteria bacterium]|nr:pseudouridine synthase [Ignavibacteria bacterium]
MKKFRYYIFNKPYRVLTQFSKSEGKLTLSDFLNLPKDVYPVGRLDYDSEGLLLLTNDGQLHNRLINPKFNHKRTYLVQVERIPDERSLQQLRDGILIDGIKTKKAKVKLLTEEPNIWERNPPIRYRKNIPTAWFEIELTEGRNRQIRKMTSAIGHPTLRLIRIKIENLSVENLKPGEWKEIELSRIWGK